MSEYQILMFNEGLLGLIQDLPCYRKVPQVLAACSIEVELDPVHRTVLLTLSEKAPEYIEGEEPNSLVLEFSSDNPSQNRDTKAG